jgi:hypothetical protein
MSDTDSSRRRPSERRQLGVGRKGLIMKRILLACGIVAGPLFIAASLTQASTRRGFDLARHPISLLSLGSLGWIQIANFVVCGILYVIGAVGLRTALRSGRGITWGPLLIGTTGVGLIIAGVFTADPGAGFPPGAPAGAPAMSWHGALHEVGFLLCFAGAIAACGVFARRYAALGRRSWMVAALAAPVASLVAVGWPDLNTLSVRLVIATATLFGFLTAVFAQVLAEPSAVWSGSAVAKSGHLRGRLLVERSGNAAAGHQSTAYQMIKPR